ESTHCFGMAAMADEHDVPSGLDLAFGLAVDLANQRAGRVEKIETAANCFGGHRLGHAVRAEYHRYAVGHFVEFLDEDRALGLQALDHVAIVHDFVADVDRRTVAVD